MSEDRTAAEAAIDEETVAKVASLARLHLTAEDTAQLATDMSNLLGYVDRLRGVDVATVEPMAHPADALGSLRPDVRVEGLSREIAVSNAPKTDGQSFLVPQILDAE